MEDIKNIVAKNIARIRLCHHMTQMELAKKLNYSDKAVSKWERGESMPDISVLVEIADLFDIALDDLVRPEGVGKGKTKQPKYNRNIITCIIEASVWLGAVIAFVITYLITGKFGFQWLYFLFTVPLHLTLRLIFNSIWMNPKHNYLIVSLLMWSVLLSVHLGLYYFGIQVPAIYLLGIPGQILIILCGFLKKSS